MIKKAFLMMGVLSIVSACASETVRLKETEYLRTRAGKPLVYPAGVDQPQQERFYVIPDLPESNRAITEKPEALIQPPRLSGVDVETEDEEAEETTDQSEQPAQK